MFLLILSMTIWNRFKLRKFVTWSILPSQIAFHNFFLKTWTILKYFRYKELERARVIFQRFVMCHPDVQNWIRWAKFEQKNGFVMKVNNISWLVCIIVFKKLSISYSFSRIVFQIFKLHLPTFSFYMFWCSDFVSLLQIRLLNEIVRTSTNKYLSPQNWWKFLL